MFSLIDILDASIEFPMSEIYKRKCTLNDEKLLYSTFAVIFVVTVSRGLFEFKDKVPFKLVFVRSLIILLALECLCYSISILSSCF